jgi:hypothetical protein
MDDDELRIKKYSEKDISELKKIKPLWAYGENLDKLMDFTQHPECDSYKIFIVRVSELVNKTEFLNLDLTKLFCGDIASDYRIMTTLERWENNKYVDPPFLSISTIQQDRLSISDGRHRVKLSSFLSIGSIPVAIHKTMVSKIKKLIDIEEVK